MQGLIGTGGDVSIISSQHWPKAWPTRPAPISIVGLGQAQGLKVQWYCLIQGLINNQLYIADTSYIADTPANLWGRDPLEQ